MPIVGQGAADEHVAVSAGRDVAVRQKDLRDYLRILWRRKWIRRARRRDRHGRQRGRISAPAASVQGERRGPHRSSDSWNLGRPNGHRHRDRDPPEQRRTGNRRQAHRRSRQRSRRTRYSPERSSRSVRHRRRRIWQQNRRMRGPMRTLPIADHWPKARRSGRLP